MKWAGTGAVNSVHKGIRRIAVVVVALGAMAAVLVAWNSRRGLTACVRNNDVATLKARLQGGFDPNKEDWSLARLFGTAPRTPLIEAIESGCNECIDVLIKGGAKIKAGRGLGDHAAYWAVQFKNDDALLRLLNNGLDPNADVVGGISLGELVFQSGQVAMMSYLLNAGLDLNKPFSGGSSAVGLAVASVAQKDLPAVLAMCVRHGFNASSPVRDFGDLSLLEWCMQDGDNAASEVSAVLDNCKKESLSRESIALLERHRKTWPNDAIEIFLSK